MDPCNLRELPKRKRKRAGEEPGRQSLTAQDTKMNVPITGGNLYVRKNYLFQSIAIWRRNNRSPKIIELATVVAKRKRIVHHQNFDGSNASTSIMYYITFQMKNGNSMECLVPRKDYSLIVHGDIGRLTHQGTKYISFER